ncbi:MAG: hypothetical protein IPJ77_00035 [Planctomycetes bacterium]|nr:hypothetical protein [Planctomycetota bacterium]
MSSSTPLRVTALLALASTAFAGGPGPLQNEILFVTDPVLDRVFECRDFNHDRLYSQPGEVGVLYDDTVGSIALDEPICITADPDDTFFVGDTGRHFILAINDRDGDGDCNDAGEHVVYFDGDPNSSTFNGSGLVMLSPTSVGLRFFNRLWVANAKTGPLDHSSILLLEDHNADGDANDAGEAVEYYVPAPGGALGDSVPTHVDQGIDGHVYFLENGSTGARARGIYELTDGDFSGVIDAPGEATAFWVTPAQPQTPVLASFDQQDDGAWTVLDSGNHRMWRLRDVNDDGSIDNGTELTLWWAYPVTHEFLDLAVSNAWGDVYTGDDQVQDELLRVIDIDQSGVIQDPAEAKVVYDDSIPLLENIDSARGMTLDFHGHEGVGLVYCTGTSGLCPCNNPGTIETGCTNSTGQGAGLEGEGTDGVINDDLEFTAFQIRAGATAVLFQGTQASGGGLGVPFGDGLVCVGGSALRLGARQADGSGRATWGPGLATPGQWVAGQTRYFQVRYRNVTGPCGSGFNYTNGLMVTFTQ